MTTSGTALFNPDVAEIIEEAYERIGIDSTSGYDVRTARRSLNILGLEWNNRQVNLWTIDSNTIPTVMNTATYTLPADTIDLLDVDIRTFDTSGNPTDLAIGRIPLSTYSTIPTKTTTGRPVQFYVDRQGPAPTLTLWPVPPDSVTYTIVYWRMRRIQDVGNDGSVTLDTPARAIPAIIAGLTYYLAMKRAPARLQETKLIYDEQFQMMIEEDRDRSSFTVVPRLFR